MFGDKPFMAKDTKTRQEDTVATNNTGEANIQADGTTKVNFTFNRNTQVVCHHCNSGWVILTVGVTDGTLTNMAVCTLAAPARPLYCPYCGRDMKG